LIRASAATIALDGCELSATTAGNGGIGVAGQVGQAPGGVGGLPDGNGAGCRGASGGAGGNGGAGAGGTGGISVALLSQGTAPTVTAGTMCHRGNDVGLLLRGNWRDRRSAQ
jgi:hypothetical protein